MTRTDPNHPWHHEPLSERSLGLRKDEDPNRDIVLRGDEESEPFPPKLDSIKGNPRGYATLPPGPYQSKKASVNEVIARLWIEWATSQLPWDIRNPWYDYDEEDD